MFKILIFVVVLFLIYLIFFKKQTMEDRKFDAAETMVECVSCKTFVSLKEAIKKDGQHFCSISCLKKENL